MSKHLERDIEVLERELISLSSIIEDMISKACRALSDRDAGLARTVIDQDKLVDSREVVIEEECLKTLALNQPVAVDLRRLAAILKINSDLERIADLAVNISERTICLMDHPDFAAPELLLEMSGVAAAMVGQALDAFVKLDVEAARAVCERDDGVDALNREILVAMIAAMKTSPEQVEPALHCFSASQHIERIADHATNIGEDVIYLVQGDIYRHQAE